MKYVYGRFMCESTTVESLEARSIVNFERNIYVFTYSLKLHSLGGTIGPIRYIIAKIFAAHCSATDLVLNPTHFLNIIL
jgi:hypothetical protein